MQRIKSTLIIGFMFFLVSAYCQKIDSIQVVNQNSTPSIHLFGWYPHTGFSITEINSQIGDTIILNLFWRECGGYTVITPFDTLITYCQSWPVVPSGVKTISILDTNTITPNCYIINELDTVEVNTFSASALSLDEFSLYSQLKIYPNPATDVIHLAMSDHIQITSIELFNINGEKVRSFRETENILEISGLQSGTYLLKISTNEGLLTRKVVFE